MISKVKCILAGACAVAIALPAVAQAAGKVDNAQHPWPLAQVYETPPPRAHAKPGTSCVAAEKYVEYTRQNDKRTALWAEDAVYLDTDGTMIKGRKAIGEWFGKSSHNNTAIPVSYLASGRDCFMEAASVFNGHPDQRYRLLVVDHFTMNEKNEIVRAVFYFRPAALAEAAKVLRK